MTSTDATTLADKKKARAEEDLYRDEATHPDKKLLLSVPLPMSVNHMYANLKNGRKVLTYEARDYIRDTTLLILAGVSKQRWQEQRRHVWYYVDMLFYMPDRRVRDSHNMIKLIMDVMQNHIFHNDYYAMPRIQGVELDERNPRLELRTSPQSNVHRIAARSMMG